MSAQIFEIYKPGKTGHDEAIEKLYAWSEESGSMLPLTPGRVIKFPLSILGFSQDNYRPLTHAAITKVEDGVASIGGYIVCPDERGQGLGGASLKNLVAEAPHYIEGIKSFQAYVNPKGLSQFEAQGGKIIGTRQPPVPTGCCHVVEFAPVLLSAIDSAPREFNLLH